jgi:hypothetical protein
MQYVRELGGRMSVDSAPGAGTRVTLWLPLFDGGGADNHAAGDTPPQTAKARQ